jgi:hypothetical protein
MCTVYPTYDRDHNLARARHYERAAEHEPDPDVREALRGVERECRRKAERAADPVLLDC